MLKDRHLQTQKEFEQEKRRNQTLQEQINDKQRQLQKLQTHYDKLKRKLLLESGPSGNQAPPPPAALGTPRSAGSRHFAAPAAADHSLVRDLQQPLRDITTHAFNNPTTSRAEFHRSTSQPYPFIAHQNNNRDSAASDTSFYLAQDGAKQQQRPSPLFFRWNTTHGK